MRREPLVVILALVGLGARNASSEVTRFIEPLRAQHARIITLVTEMETLVAAGTADEDKLAAARARLCGEAGSFHELFNDFRNARTRHGLEEEFDLLRQSLVALERLQSMYRAMGGETVVPPTPEEQDLIRRQLRDYLLRRLKDKIAKRLESEGLREILTADSWNEAREIAVRQAHEKLRREIEDEMERLVGLRFYSRESLARALRNQARLAVERGVAKLLVRVTTNELVIQWAAGVLIRWIGPKLKEALRGKGNLDFRVQRSVGTLEASRRSLNALKPDSHLSSVRAAVDRAQRAINATRYLQGDLQRADQAPLLGQLVEAITNLQRTINITVKRFLLDKKDYEEDFEVADGFLSELERTLGCAQLATAETPREQQQPTPSVPRIDFPPKYLIHVIEVNTPAGPQKRDVWVIRSGKPDENGVFLDPDGYGGVFVTKSDRTLGPFTSNYQLAPVLKGLGLKGIWVGRRYVSAELNP
ncbi:MAG: hypothetical protein ACE5O2_07030 [Armatimonadota bacterium]